MGEETKKEEQGLVPAPPTAIGVLAIDWSKADVLASKERPSDVDPNDLAGLEDIDRNRIKLPRLAIAQGLSKQLDPEQSDYVDGLKLYELFNNTTKAVYGRGPLVVIPVKTWVKWIEFDPDNRGVPLDLDVPPGDARTKWTKSAEAGGKGVPPRATEYVEFACVLLAPGFEPEPIVVSIKTTNKWNRKAADDWTTYIGMRNAAIYRGLYHISSKPEKNDEGTFGTFVVKNAGWVPTGTDAGKALLEMAKSFHESLASKVIDVQREPGMDDADEFPPQGGAKSRM